MATIIRNMAVTLNQGSMINNNRNLIKPGLALYLDAGEPTSYPGTGTAWSDLSGNNNNGVLTNGPTYNSSNGGSIVFDGTNDYVDCGNSGSIGITGDLTICAWVYVNAFTGYNGIAGKTGGSGNIAAPYDYYMNITTGIIQLYRGDGTSSAVINSTSAVTLSTWNFIAVTCSGLNVVHYLNGNTNGSGTLIGVPFANSSNNLRIGSRADGVTLMNGRIANVTIYNRALSQSEIIRNFGFFRSRYFI